MHFAVLLFPGAEELDVFGPFEVLQAARSLGAAFECRLLSVEDVPEVRLAHGTVVRPEGVCPCAMDWLIVPGGGWANHAALGARSESTNPAMLALLRKARASGTCIAGVCTGSMILAAAGLLENRAATTHHSALADLAATGVRVTAGRVVDDGDTVTCGGVTAGIDLALWLVERVAGPELAQRTSDYLEYPGASGVNKVSV